MALLHIGVSIIDDDGDVSTCVIKVPQGTLTLAEMVEFGQEIATLVDAISDGKITEISLILNLQLPGGLKANPVAFSEVQKGGLFAFSANGTPYRHSVRVPALTPSLFAGNAINTADADVAAFIAAMEDGLDATGTQVQPSNKYEMDIVSLLTAVKSHRR